MVSYIKTPKPVARKLRPGKAERLAKALERKERLAASLRALAVPDTPGVYASAAGRVLPIGNGKAQTCGWNERHARQIGRWGTTNNRG